MDSKPDLEKLFPSFQHFHNGCHAIGVMTAAQNISTCVETLDDVSVDMGSAIYKSVQSCMQGNCTKKWKKLRWAETYRYSYQNIDEVRWSAKFCGMAFYKASSLFCRTLLREKLTNRD